MRAKSVLQTTSGTYYLAETYHEAMDKIRKHEADKTEGKSKFIEFNRYDSSISSTSQFPLIVSYDDIKAVEYS